MFYPAYIHKDADSAYGVTFPDFPGCYSAADEIEDLPRLAQEAVEVHFEGEGLQIPRPSSPEDWKDDERFEGGYWMLIDIDLSKSRALSRNMLKIHQIDTPLNPSYDIGRYWYVNYTQKF